MSVINLLCVVVSYRFARFNFCLLNCARCKIDSHIFILGTLVSLNCSAEITIFRGNSFLQPLNCICYFCTCIARVVRALIL